MELKEALKEACIETLMMFGLEPKFMAETSDKSLNSATDVNILIGLTGGLRGNILLGMDRDISSKVASIMMGGMEITQFDEIVTSALGEMVNMLTGSAVAKIDCKEIIEFSSPTVITGEDIFLIISNIPSRILSFDLAGGNIQIAFAIEG